MKKLLLVTLISSFVVACGGGSGGSANAEKPTPTETKEQIEKRLNLPPEPDMAVDEQTVLGIDSNNNKINDHVERLIGFALPNNDSARKIYNREAELWTLMVESKDNQNKLQELYNEYSLVLDCQIKGYVERPKSLKYILDEYVRTGERAVLLATIESSVNFLNYSDYETKNYCQNFK